MRHLEETKQKHEIPPPCDTHQHTHPRPEASLPNSGFVFPDLGKAAVPSSQHSTATPLSHSANSAQSNDTLPRNMWSSKVHLQGQTDKEHSFARLRAVVQDDDLDRAFSPSVSSLDASVNHDSDEDCETTSNAEHRRPKIGWNHQADLEGLYGSELAEDNATLLWDPETMGDEQLEVLLAQCKVSDSTFKTAQSNPTSSSAPSGCSDLLVTPLNSSMESETISASSSSSILSSEPTTSNFANFLSLAGFLELVHETEGVTTETMAHMKRRGLFGWSPLQSGFAVWEEDEMDRFEMAMASFAKDFDRIASIVRTRSVGECIVFYYAWKHSERCRVWRGQISPPDLLEAKEDEALSVPHSRMLPSHHYHHIQPIAQRPATNTTSRKRKREIEAPLDNSDRLYLEALDSLHAHAEHADHLMLNLILNAPDTLVEDLAPHTQLSDVSHESHVGASLGSLDASLPPHGHHAHAFHSETTAHSCTPLTHAVNEILLPDTSSVSLSSACLPSQTLTCLDENPNAQALSDGSTGPNTNTVLENTGVAFARYISAASPKRAKMAEPDDHMLFHAVDLRSSTVNAAPTVDPAAMFSLFSPPEPTLDFFMHF